MTTIRISEATKKRLEKLGDLSDTWDTLLNAFADFVEGHLEEWWVDDDEDDDEDEEGEGSDDVKGVAA